jgi:hypothetical protein
MFMENQQQQDLTPEEIAARKQEMLDFYNESMEYLEAQYKYEKLLADIDESRLRRASVQMQFAKLMQAQYEAEEEASESKEKKLKTK